MERLRREYPDVPASSWQKRCGKGYIDDMGLSRLVELHWYEAPEIGRIEMKVKRFL